jgi:hypothetical protein
MDGRGKVHLSVFLEDNNTKVIGAVEVKSHTFSDLVINAISDLIHESISLVSGRGPLTFFREGYVGLWNRSKGFGQEDSVCPYYCSVT